MPRILKAPWLDSFVSYMSAADAPNQFIFWSGVGILAAVLKRNAFYKRKMQIVYPNHYIILCGGPGTGKGSAMMPALEIMKKSGCCNLLYDRMSAEKMVEIIANGFGSKVVSPTGTVKLGIGGHDTSVCIYEDELSALFGISDWMLDFFNKVWTDGYFKYSTKSGNEVEVVDNATTILGGCVPEFLKNINRSKTTMTVSSGFTSRSIVSFSSSQAKITDYWGELGGNKISFSQDDLIEDLRYLATYCIGEYNFSPEAKKLLSEFDQEAKSTRDSSGSLLYDSDIVIFFKNRIATHAGKLSMILCASEKDDRYIEAHHTRKAIQELVKVKNDLDIAFRFIGESKDVDAQARILDFIEHKGQTNRSEILRYLKNHVTGDQLDRILLVLNEVGITRYAASAGSSLRSIIYNVNNIKP